MNAGDTLVSIITPSLDQGRFLRQAIESIKAQTYSNIEHIVIDGGSTDETATILGEYTAHARVRWRSEPDSGMYDALNKGLKLATGEILGYLNCDDAYTPWAVDTAVRVLRANPDADVVFGDGLTIDESTGKQRLSLIPAFDRRSLALVGSLVQPAVFWRRRAFERLGPFDPQLRYVGDLDYWLRLGGAARFVRVDEVLAIERRHEGALSTASADRMAAEAAIVRQRHHGAYGLRSRVETVVARIRAAMWRRYLWLRFLAEVRGGAAGDGPWHQFIRSGELRVSRWRVAAMLLPRLGATFAWGAIASRRDWLGAAGTDRS